MIPRRLHQFWIGPSPAPSTWMQTWKEAHPDWHYRIWDERGIKRLRLRNARLFRQLCDIGRYDGASDVARGEILLRYGGVWVDADSECLKPLDGAPFLEARFFAVRDPIIPEGWAVVREVLGDVDHLVAGGFMGAEAGHRILRRYVDSLSRVLATKQLTPTWITVGGVLLQKAIGDDPDGLILPPWVFFDRNLNGEQVAGGEPYARHFWGSTAGREGPDPFAGATPYPGQPRGSIPDEYDARAGVRSMLHKLGVRGRRVVGRLSRLSSKLSD
jgi:Glycosyltransferase sugar-binding region containing DXD motif